MALQFDPSAYLAAFKIGQQNEQYNNQRPEQIIQDLGQIGQGMANYGQRQKEDRLQQLTTAGNLSSQGIDPGPAMSWLATGKFPVASNSLSQENPQPSTLSPGQSASLMPNMQPPAPRPGMGQMASAGMPDTGYPSQPSPTPPTSIMPPASGSLVDRSPWKTQAPAQTQPTGIASLFQKKPIDYTKINSDIESGNTGSLMNLPPSQRNEFEKTREFTQKFGRDYSFIGTDKTGNPVFADKSGNIKVGQMPGGGAIQPKPTSVTTQGANFDSASPQEQKLAVALAKGDIRAQDLSYRDRGRVVTMANEYAEKNGIPFQSYAGNVKEKFAENISSGKMGMNALSLNTALGHAGDAADAFEKIQNTNQNWLNIPLNKLKKMTNDPNVIALDINLNALNGELATTFKNSSGTDQEIGHWMDVLNDNLTPAQAQGAFQKVSSLLNSRLNAMEYQQQNVMGNTNMGRKLLSPHGADVMKKIGAPPQPGIPQVGEVRKGYQFRGGDPSQQTSWEKVQ